LADSGISFPAQGTVSEPQFLQILRLDQMALSVLKEEIREGVVNYYEIFNKFLYKIGTFIHCKRSIGYPNSTNQVGNLIC